MTATASSASGETAGRELALRIQAGEREAEAELVARYSRGVGIIVRRIARDASLAEDLSQETFRLVLERVRRGELREPEKLSGFVCSVARNLAIEQVRQPQRLVPLEESNSPASDAEADPLSAVLLQEKIKAVRQVVEEMTTGRDREILARFYLKEQDKDRICEELELSSLHFNRVLYRARERFRELYEKGHGPQPSRR